MFRTLTGTIHKTECVYCFEDRFNQDGLLLCMHCDTVCCANHAYIHTKKTNHSLFYNFKMVHKINLEDNPKIQEILKKKQKTISESTDLPSVVTKSDELYPYNLRNDDEENYECECKFQFFNRDSKRIEDIDDLDEILHKIIPNCPEKVMDNLLDAVADFTNTKENKNDSYLFPNYVSLDPFSTNNEAIKSFDQIFGCNHLREILKYPSNYFDQDNLNLIDLENARRNSMQKIKYSLQCYNNMCCSERDCNINKNLWICLKCGFIGCGRKQAGIEGASHALAHYSLTGHEICMKLTSIANGICELYCYKCDDEKKYDFSSICKQRFLNYIANTTPFNYLKIIEILTGITKNPYGSEKSLTELSLDEMAKINNITTCNKLQRNFVRLFTDETTKKCCFDDSLSRVFFSENVPSCKQLFGGLLNRGNTCYANAVMQCLKALKITTLSEPIDLAMTANEHYEKCKKNPIVCAKCQYFRFLGYGWQRCAHAVGLLRTTGRYLLSNENIGRQQDSSEFMDLLSDALNFTQKFSLPKICNEFYCRNCHGIIRKPSLNQQLTLELDALNTIYTSYNEALFKSNDKSEMIIKWCEKNIVMNQLAADNWDVSMQTLIDEKFLNQLGNLINDPIKCSLCGNLNMIKTSSIYGAISNNDFPKNLCIKVNRLHYNKEKNIIEKINGRVINVEQINFNKLITNEKTENEKFESKKAWDIAFKKLIDPNDKDTENKNEEKEMVQDFKDTLDTLVSMGYDKEISKKLLLKCGNNIEYILDLIDSGNYESLLEEKQESTTTVDPIEEFKFNRNETEALCNYRFEDIPSTKYNLVGFISHLGNSVNAGHYVTFIRLNSIHKNVIEKLLKGYVKDGSQPISLINEYTHDFNEKEDWWLLFDDGKISLVQQPMEQHTAYLYYYTKSN